MISAGYGSPALLLHGLPQGNPARAAILLVLARAVGTRAVGTRAALENLERVAAAAAAVGAILKDGQTMDGTATAVPENLERAVHLVRDGTHPVRLGLLARVASLALKDGTLEDTDGVERDPSLRGPSRKDPRQRDRSLREAREDGVTAAILTGATAAILAGALESLASLVDLIGLPTQVIGLAMVGAVPESRVRVAAVEVETRGLTLHTTHGMTQESRVRVAAVEVETHGPTVTHGATVATQVRERVARDQAEVETHGPTVALMTGPTVATQAQERVAREQADLLVSLQESQERHHLMKDGLLAVMIGRLLPTLQESPGRQVLVPTAMKPAIQQQRPCHLTRNIQIAERLDGY